MSRRQPQATSSRGVLSDKIKKKEKNNVLAYLPRLLVSGMNFTVCLVEVSNFVFVVIRSFCEAETAPNNELALILPPKSKKAKDKVLA